MELFTPVFEESLHFFTEVLSMDIVETADDTAYLRTWDDYERFSLKLSARDEPGVGRVGVRAVSEAALHLRAEAIHATGFGHGWVDGQPGRGATYTFADPDGHEWDIYFQSARFTPSDPVKPALKNQAQRRPNHGVGVRRLDHVNFLAADVEASRDFVTSVLGAQPTEQIQLDNGAIAGIWMTFTNKGYDVVYTNDWTKTRGRLHHVAFAVDQREDILRGADLFLEGWAPLIVFTGNLGWLTRTMWQRPEAELFAEVAGARGVPRERMLIESRSTNTGENVGFTRALLAERGFHPRKAIAVQKPYMERRGHATFRQRWPELEVLATSPQIDFDAYPTETILREDVIHIMVGDFQRLIVYAERGWSAPQTVPSEVMRAYERLVAAGYTRRLLD